MAHSECTAACKSVALLTEGVDRNVSGAGPCVSLKVALLTEGVDRNFAPLAAALRLVGRPPHGGRG